MSIIALPFPVFKPAMRGVLNITNAFPAVVTTTLDGTTPGDHGYIDKLIVRIDMVPGYGMQEIDQKFGLIVVLTSSTFAIDIDTTLFSAFTTPVTYPKNAQYCQANPFAEDNSILTGAVQNVLPY